MQTTFKLKAIELRRSGKTYSEILQEVPVAKSTLSLWLRSIGLSKRQKQILTQKKLAAALRGSQARRIDRLKATEQIKKDAVNEVAAIEIDQEKLLLMGTMLYWAEGDKEKSYRSGVGVGFSNSDPAMIRLFLCWAVRCLKVSKKRFTFRIYLHENNLGRLEEIKTYWAKQTGFPVGKFDRITLKRHKPSSSRRNKGAGYYGLIRVRISKSTNLNRKIAGWAEGIVKQCPVV